MGASERSTTRRLCRCSPSATANSQPMAGLTPWNMPSPASASHGHSAVMAEAHAGGASATIGRCSRIAIGVRRAVAPLQSYLMRQMALRPLDEERRVECEAAFRLGVKLDHPAL